jgi:hypothetical protein
VADVFLKLGFGQTRFFGPSLKIAFFAVVIVAFLGA